MIRFWGSIPPAYVAWRAGTTNRVVAPSRQAGNRFLGSLKGLQIRAQASGHLFKDDMNGFSSISVICFMVPGFAKYVRTWTTWHEWMPVAWYLKERPLWLFLRSPLGAEWMEGIEPVNGGPALPLPLSPTCHHYGLSHYLPPPPSPRGVW